MSIDCKLDPKRTTAGAAVRPGTAATALALAAAGVILLLGACADRNSGYAPYPDRWEYRHDPSDNYGRIRRY